MPTTPSRAGRWIKTRKATGFWKQGIYCVRLNVVPSGRVTQPIAAGVDPGSKREGFTLKSATHTYLNIQAEAVTQVSDKLKARREMRRGRRFRKTPYRKCRPNRGQAKAKGRIPPSTHARWNAKLRTLKQVAKVFPVTDVVVEDIQASTRRRRKGKQNKQGWNATFSPLQVGKAWFYVEIERAGWTLHLRQGYETKTLRDKWGLKKTSRKLDEKFEAHCVDSWALANDVTGGHVTPDNTSLMVVKFLEPKRRQLHRFQPDKGGIRNDRGGTASEGLVRGSLVVYKGRGLGILGGWTKVGLTINTLAGQPKYKAVKRANIEFVAHNKWVTKYIK